MKASPASSAVKRSAYYKATEAIVGVLHLYQRFISPLKGQRCRFYPTCSEYAVQAVREWGALAGLGISALRLLRCNPLHPGGYDPVPPRRTRRPTPRV